MKREGTKFILYYSKCLISRYLCKQTYYILALSAGAVEYADCTSAEG